MEEYPPLRDMPEWASIWERVRRMRIDDIADFTNLSQGYLRGRLVGKVPSASNDVAATDKVGDLSYALDGSYIYILVNASGTPAWRRIALGNW